MAYLRDGKPALHLNIRYPVKTDGAAHIANIKKHAEAAGFVVEINRDSAPAYFDPGHPVVSALTELFNKITGKDTKPFAMAGGTYARKLPRAIGFGPGGVDDIKPDFLPDSHGGGHGPDEAIHVDSLLKAMAILAAGVVVADGIV